MTSDTPSPDRAPAARAASAPIDGDGRADVVLAAGTTSLADLARAVAPGARPLLDRSARPAVDAAAACLERATRGERPVYGVNTGFGKLASVRIASGDLAALQRNLILSHCAGVGEPAPADVVRMTMILKLLSLGRGASGVRWALIECLEQMLARGVLPVVPAQGSVGASGDLAPLAHLAAVMIGEGEAVVDGRRRPGGEAMRGAGIEPVVLTAKEGLALINGTQYSTAMAVLAWQEAVALLRSAVLASALSTDAIMGSTAPLVAELHTLRGHPGQIAVAATLRALMSGSRIRDSHRDGDSRVQDPYCVRCQPQVAGACLDLLAQSGRTLAIEANAATDNPLVIVGRDAVLSGGNFHAEPVAFAADQIALAIAETGAISQRRIALMVDPALSFDLPPFLTPDPGLNSGFMVAEITSAALMSENKHLANPCSTDSTPTSANQEDHVSMAAHGARRLQRMNANLARIVGIEVLCAAAGIEHRAPLATSGPLRAAIARLRRDVAPLREDRFLAPDLETAARLVRDGALVEAAACPALSNLGDPA